MFAKPYDRDNEVQIQHLFSSYRCVSIVTRVVNRALIDLTSISEGRISLCDHKDPIANTTLIEVSSRKDESLFWFE